jgi:DNA helicase II / ATP-dependent DNA helicase PcrA
MIVKNLPLVMKIYVVVGDDSQSIYSFRGASIQNILNFEKDYPDLATFKLEHNYRSSSNIVNASSSIISRNKEKTP